MNLNTDFLLDIWADLKAKKLAPVAIGLVVMAVAMPALMLRGDDATVDGPLPIVAPTASNGAKVEVAEELADGSKLESYSKARDPFEGMVKPEADAPTGGGAATAPGDDALKLPGATGGSSGGSTGGGDLGGGLSPTPGSDPNFSPNTPPTVVRRPGARYNYQLDLKLGRPGREKRYPHVARLAFLPSPSLPALLFMGVTVDEGSALFFVHPGLNHQGEGDCVPSAKDCNFLRLGIGKEHYLSADDHEFHIKLLDINRVKLSEERKQRERVRKASARRSARSNRGHSTSGKTGVPSEDQHEYPWLVDGIG